ncbi:MAG: hypothetical protein ACOYKD_02650 [Anaerolineaceae bacterium]
METKPVRVAAPEHHWYLLTGIVIGLVAGLLVSMVFLPLTNREALPRELSEGGKEAYRLMIAQAFEASPDVNRAVSRLNLLEDADPAAALITQAQKILAAGGDEASARALAVLAEAVMGARP